MQSAETVVEVAGAEPAAIAAWESLVAQAIEPERDQDDF